MVHIPTPGYDGLVDHFNQISQYLEDVQDDVFSNLNYISKTANRTRRYQTAVSSELDHLFYHAHSWADTGITKAYLGGWQSVYGSETAVVPPQALQRMEAIREDYRKRLNEIEQYARRDTTRFLREARRMQPDQVDKMNAIQYQKFGVKAVEQRNVSGLLGGATKRRYRLGPWGHMQTDAINQRAFNAGTLDAAQVKKIEVMEVHDGPGCGWTSHDDPDTANGKLVTVEEARSYPIAHPHCQRSFIPRPDLKKEDLKHAAALSAMKRATEITAGLTAAGLIARALVQVETHIADQEDIVSPAALARIGGVYKKAWNTLVDQFYGTTKLADVHKLPFYEFELPPAPPQQLPLAAGFGGGEGTVASVASKFGAPTFEGMKEATLKWGDAFMDHRVHLPDLPDWVKKAVDATNVKDPEDMEKKFMLFSKWVQKSRRQNLIAEQGAKVLNFQAKRRQWNEYTLFKNAENLRSAASFTWTKWGPRTRIDMSEFLRGRITLTKDGLRRSLTLNPAGNLRSMLALSQDGTLMGALRLVPNRMFRAIIETDEFGKITGNVRLIPKGPFKVILKFDTPRPKNWQYKGLVAGRDFVDLRTFNLHDFSFREVYGNLRQLELKSLEFELRILNESPLEISAKTQIPLREIKDTLRTLKATGLMRPVPGSNRWIGIFRYKPSFAAIDELQKLVAATKTTIYGNISFAQIVPKLRWVAPEIKSRAYFFGGQFHDMVGAVRVSGIEAFKKATKLEVFSEILDLPQAAWMDFVKVWDDVTARIEIMMRNHNFHQPQEIMDFFEARLGKAVVVTGSDSDEVMANTLEYIEKAPKHNVFQLGKGKVIPDIGGKLRERTIYELADIQPGDNHWVIERKLQDMFFSMKMNLWTTSENQLFGRMQLITNEQIHFAAYQLERSDLKPLVAPTEFVKLSKNQLDVLVKASQENLDRLLEHDPNQFLALTRYKINSRILNTYLRDGTTANMNRYEMTDDLQIYRERAGQWIDAMNRDDHLTESEMNAIYEKITNSPMYKELDEVINAWKESGDYDALYQGIDRVLAQEADSLEQALFYLRSHETVSPSVVFRGIRDPEMYQFLDRAPIGTTFEERLIGSWSANPEVAQHFASGNGAFTDPRNYVLRVVNSGNHGTMIADAEYPENVWESEFLYHRRMRFKIISRDLMKFIDPETGSYKWGRVITLQEL